MDAIGRLTAYVAGVHCGSILAPLYVRLAVNRFAADLKRADLYFDTDELLRFDRFASRFKHYKGEMAGQFFALEPWQIFIAANILALKVKATGRRKYRYAEIYLPRKNGKTFLASILALYLFLVDKEGGPEVYTAALDEAQAKLCYDNARTVVQASEFAPLVKVMMSRAKMDGVRNHGVFKPLSRDTKNKDGLNIHAAVCDERHAWPNTEMMDVIKTGMGARAQPLLISISTAGVDVNVPYFSDINAYKAQLDGILPLDDNYFYMLYCPDEGDSWEDEHTWLKVNPNLGVSLSWDYMRAVYQEAKTRGGTFEAAFKTKNLNLWVDAPTVWIPDEAVEACNQRQNDEDLNGEECYVGIDFARRVDIAATALYFPRLRRVRMLFFLPESKVIADPDKAGYRQWRDEGWINSIPGDVIDEDWFFQFNLKELAKYRVKAIAYDPWGLWNMGEQFKQYSGRLVEWNQNIRHMSAPTKELEGMIHKGEIQLGGNPVLRWMFRNVVLYKDPNDNIKTDKGRSRSKIDGVVALIDAIGVWMDNRAKGKTITATHNMISLKRF